MMLQVLTGPCRSSPAQWMQLRINQILLAPEVQAGCQWPEQIPEDLKALLNGDLSGSPRDNLDAITRRVLQSDPTLFTEWYPHFVDWAHSLARHPHPDCRSAHVHATMQHLLEMVKAMPEKASAILPMVRKLLLSSDLAGMSGALAFELLAQLGEEEESSALLWDRLVRSQPTQPELLEALQVLPSLARQDSAARGAVVERMAALVPPGMQRAMQRLLMARLRLLRLPESGNRHQGRSVREAIEAAQTLWSSNPPISDEMAVAVWDVAVQSALSARIPSQHRWMQLLVARTGANGVEGPRDGRSTGEWAARSRRDSDTEASRRSTSGRSSSIFSWCASDWNASSVQADLLDQGALYVLPLAHGALAPSYRDSDEPVGGVRPIARASARSGGDRGISGAVAA